VLKYDASMPTIAQLEKLLSLDPDDPFIHYGLGQEYAQSGDHERAIACYTTVLELDAQYCYAYYFQGQSLNELGRIIEAKQVISAGIESARKAQDTKAIAELTGLLQSIE